MVVCGLELHDQLYFLNSGDRRRSSVTSYVRVNCLCAAVNSTMGFILALAALISDLVYQEHHSVWYIDPVLGICCSFCFFIYAIW